MTSTTGKKLLVTKPQDMDPNCDRGFREVERWLNKPSTFEGPPSIPTAGAKVYGPGVTLAAPYPSTQYYLPFSGTFWQVGNNIVNYSRNSIDIPQDGIYVCELSVGISSVSPSARYEAFMPVLQGSASSSPVEGTEWTSYDASQAGTLIINQTTVSNLKAGNFIQVFVDRRGGTGSEVANIGVLAVFGPLEGGTVGPPGPAGSAGPPGPAGPAGPAGSSASACAVGNQVNITHTGALPLTINQSIQWDTGGFTSTPNQFNIATAGKYHVSCLVRAYNNSTTTDKTYNLWILESAGSAPAPLAKFIIPHDPVVGSRTLIFSVSGDLDCAAGSYIYFQGGLDSGLPVDSGDSIGLDRASISAVDGGGGGGTGAALAFHYSQATAASTWTIVHNLSFFPNVAVVDSTGREVFGEVNYLNSTTVQVTFSAAFGGDAYLS